MNKLETPRKIKSQQTKAKIFKAAQKLLKKHGYEYLTVKNICEEAKISNGTFFHYFKTKDDLLAYYFEEGFDNYLAKQVENTHNKNVKEQIMDDYISYGSYCKENDLDFISNYYSTKNKALDTRTVRGKDGSINNSILMNRTVEVLIEAQQNGLVLPDVNPVEIGRDLCTLLKGIMFDWCLSQGTDDLEPKIQKFLGIYLDRIVTEKFKFIYSPSQQMK